MENVGQALRQDTVREINSKTSHGFEKGALMATFSNNAISEAVQNALFDPSDETVIEETFGAEIADNVENFLHHFERAEYSLGHALDNPDVISKAFLENSENVISISNHHNFQYSLKETSHEQDSATLSGDSVDKNLDTEIGRLKIGIQDSETTAKKDNVRAFRTLIAQAILNEQEQIAAEIRDLRARIEEIEAHLAEIEEAQEALEEGNINDNSTAGAARRKKVETALSKQGKSLDDFRKEDGTLDQEAISEALAEEEARQLLEREARHAELDALLEKQSKIQQDIDNAVENGDAEAIAKLSAEDTNSDLRIDTMSVEDSLSLLTVTEEDIYLASALPDSQYMPDNSSFETEEGDIEFTNEFSDFPDFDSSDPNDFSYAGAAEADNTVADNNNISATPIEPSVAINTERSYGSFAEQGLGEEMTFSTNMPDMSGAFKTAHSGETKEPQKDIEADLQNIYAARLSSPGGMA